MKIQYLAILFIIIVVPVLLVLQYYIDLQSDTLALQAEYDEKLVSATKQGLEAFEINTVEWNSETSDLSDSLRRDINASVNVFVNSLANNLSIGGASKELILSYIPAVAFTLNDGYYIYTPTYVPITAKDENGITKKDEEGRILYMSNTSGETPVVTEAKTEYKHVLKTFVPYQKQIGDYVFNFSLDNYVKVYTKISEDGEEKVIKRSGHYHEGLDEGDYEPETLSENIVVRHGEAETGYQYKIEEYSYIYDQNGQKLYYDKSYLDENGQGTFFTLSSDAEKIYLVESQQEEDIGYRYKTLLIAKNDTEYEVLYQGLNGSRKGFWYKDNSLDGYLSSDEKFFLNNEGFDIDKDFSAINYYVEASTFTNWIDSIKNSFTEEEKEIFNGDLTTNWVKRQIIRDSIETNLQMAMATFSKYSGNEYKLPYFKEVEWERIYSNVSIITFFEGVPIGLKRYNNYAIETSTTNNVYVSDDCLYYHNKSDKYYHRYGCKRIQSSIGEIKAYKNTDYVMKKKNDNNYYKHTVFIPATNDYGAAYECYYCLVNEAEYEEIATDIYDRVRNISLAREKYVNSVMVYDFNQKPEPPNPYADYIYQIFNNGQAVGGENTLQETLEWIGNSSFASTDYLVRIKSDITTLNDTSTSLNIPGNNVENITIDFTTNTNIAEYNYSPDSTWSFAFSDTITLRVDNLQTVNINNDIKIGPNSFFRLEGNGNLNTRSLLCTNNVDGASSSLNSTWNIKGKLYIEKSKVNLGKVNINLGNDKYLHAISLNSSNGYFEFSEENFYATGIANEINMQIIEIKTDKNLICEGATIRILGKTDNANIINVNNININESGKVQIFSDISLECGNIENYGEFQFGNNGTGATGKNFKCIDINNWGNVSISNTGNVEIEGMFDTEGSTSISNSGNIKCSDEVYVEGSLDIANTGQEVRFMYAIIVNNGGILDISGPKEIYTSLESIIMATAGSTINIEPGAGKTINFINNNTSGRVITMKSASEAANTSTTWSTDRTIVNIKNGNITSNVSGILQYGGKLNIDNANITVTEQGTVSGGTYIIQAGLKSQVDADRTYPRVQINNSTLTQTTTNANSDGIRVGLGTILQIKNSTVNAYGRAIDIRMETFFNVDLTNNPINQYPQNYKETYNWYKSATDNSIPISQRTEAPIVIIHNSTVKSENLEPVYLDIGYIQLTECTLNKEVELRSHILVKETQWENKVAAEVAMVYNSKTNPVKVEYENDNENGFSKEKTNDFIFALNYNGTFLYERDIVESDLVFDIKESWLEH